MVPVFGASCMCYSVVYIVLPQGRIKASVVPGAVYNAGPWQIVNAFCIGLEGGGQIFLARSTPELLLHFQNCGAPMFILSQ